MELRDLNVGVVTTYPPGEGSLNEYGFHFIRCLAGKPEVGRITVFCDYLPEGQRYETTESKIIFKPCWRFNSIGSPLDIARAVQQDNPDVLVYNIQFATFGDDQVAAALGLVTPALTRMLGYPSIVLLHNIMETIDLANTGFADSKVKEMLLRTFGYIATTLLLRADALALTIPKYVDLISSRYHTSKALLAPHGAFEDMPRPDARPYDGPRRIMTFGKFGTYKRIEVLLDAYELLLTRGYDDLELVVGGGDSPNTPGYIDSMIRRAQHLKGVRFLGYVPEEDVAELFTNSRIVVFPYTSTTGSSGVLHQAGQFGNAVVLPDLGDLAELVVEEGYAGEFFEPEDSESLADAMSKLLDDDHKRSQMGEQNYLAAKGLAMDDVVDWYLFHIERILKRKAQRRRLMITGRKRED